MNHKLGHVVIKTDGNGKETTAAMLGMTMRETLKFLRGGSNHDRAGITKTKGLPRNKVKSKMAKASRRKNRG